ncbi:MAG: response regulator [Deltaproteobacteria bacterium]|nr:response regulator [Deltaproteobacteria bacterium]MBN2671302.1 response regulator [Deltaproteobacteria bacterium]
MHYLSIIPFISFFIILFVWFYIWASPASTPAKRAVLFFAALDLVFLGFELLMFVPVFEPYIPIFFMIMAPFWTLLGFGFLNFVYRWLEKPRDVAYGLLLLLSLAAGAYFVFSGKVHLGHEITPWGVKDIRNPHLHALTAFPSIAGGAYGLILIALQLRREGDKSARKIHQMILLGGVLTMSTVVLFDVVLPDFFGTQLFIRLGSSMFVFFIVLVFLAVRKYRFLHFDMDDVALPFFEEMQDAVFWVEDGTRVRKMNRKAKQWFNAPENYEGTDIREYLPQPEKKRIRVKLNGSFRRMKISSYSTMKNELELLRVFIVRDETEIQEARELLRWVRDEMEAMASQRSERLRQAQRLEALATLSGGIAHEFNNLLTTTMGYTSAALDDLKQGDPVREDLLEVLSATERARDIIKQMLSFSDVENRELAPLDLNTLTRDALKILNVSVPGNVSISFSAEDNCFTLGDSTRLHQAVINLLTNGVHAMEGFGGHLRVQVKEVVVGDKEYCVNTTPKPGVYISIQVTDTGCGISKENLEHIFEPFFTTKKQGHGTGIGLATVFRVMEEHSGGVRVMSELNQGTTFELLLPRWRGKTEETQEPGATLSTPVTGTILLVDDNALVIKVTRRILEPLGYHIISYEHPDAVLDALQNNPMPVDLALVDFGLPSMDGLALSKKIWTLLPQLPIILFSGKMTPSLQKQAEKKGLQGCLSKPLSKQQLVEAVSSILQARGES